MIFSEVKPLPALRHLVRNYLVVNLKSEAPLPPTPYPARIEQALVFFARGHIKCTDPQNPTPIRIAHNAIFGQQVARLNFQSIPSEDFMMIMVVFQPGGLHRLLKIPAHELCGHFCDAEALLGPGLKSVNDAIANTCDYQKMVHYLDRYLLAKLSSIKPDRHPVDAIGNLLLEKPDHFSLDYLARQACLSPRQLERKFKERVGIGPKLYNKISRFYKAFACKENNPAIDWLTIALSFKYSDYAHLAKDFRQFGCVTPNILIEELAHRPEAVLREFMEHGPFV